MKTKMMTKNYISRLALNISQPNFGSKKSCNSLNSRRSSKSHLSSKSKSPRPMLAQPKGPTKGSKSPGPTTVQKPFPTSLVNNSTLSEVQGRSPHFFVNDESNQCTWQKSQSFQVEGCGSCGHMQICECRRPKVKLCEAVSTMQSLAASGRVSPNREVTQIMPLTSSNMPS